MSLKRTMLVIRQNAGQLVIHNAIALEESAMAEIERFGTPAILLVPNGMHRLDAPAYKRRYPALRVFTPSGSRAKVEQVIPVDGTYDDFPSSDAVRAETLHGVGEAEGVLTVHSHDGVSVVLNDCLFNMDRKRDPLGFVITTVFGSAPGPRVSRLSKMLLIKDKAALRADFERLAELPNLTRVFVAHEKVASGADARDALRKAATFL
jgi:hypothetical protein